MFFPFVLSMLSDCLVSLGRIGKYLLAEELPGAYPIDSESKHAVVVDGDFTWETQPFNKNIQKKDGKQQSQKTESLLPITQKDIPKQEKSLEGDNDAGSPFKLKDLRLRIETGSFVGIVGKVGSRYVHCYLLRILTDNGPNRKVQIKLLCSMQHN